MESMAFEVGSRSIWGRENIGRPESVYDLKAISSLRS